MSTITEQMPIVVSALNEGFIQTLKLFFITLIGALPLGLIIPFGSMTKFKPLRQNHRLDCKRYTFDDSAFNYLLFSRSGA